MLLGSNYRIYCPARTGKVAEILDLPTSIVPIAVKSSGTIPFCEAEFVLYYDDEDMLCTPVSSVKFPAKFELYLRRIITPGGVLGFTRNWTSETGVRGTKLGELDYDGSGFWRGEISHPNTDFNSGSIHLAICHRHCKGGMITFGDIGTAGNFVGRFGDSPGNLTHRIEFIGQQGDIGIPRAALLRFGGVWWDEEDTCATTLDAAAYAEFPSWYYSLPTQYHVSGGSWDHIIQTGTRVVTSRPECEISIFGGSYIPQVAQLTPGVCQMGGSPHVWRFMADMSGRCSVADEEPAWARLQNGFLGLVQLVGLEIGFGRQWPGVSGEYFGHPDNTVGGQNAWRTYSQVPIDDPDGGWDWLDTNTMIRDPATSILPGAAYPTDSLLESKYFDSVAPDELVITPHA